MKKLISFLLLCTAAWLGCSGNSNSTSTSTEQAADQTKGQPAPADSSVIPGMVVAKFNSLFPNVGPVGWEMEGNDYEATFKYEVGEKSVLFTPEGEVISAETDINSNSLPEAMLNYISKNLQGKKIERAQMITTAAGSITYSVTAGQQEYIFDGSGNFLKIEDHQESD